MAPLWGLRISKGLLGWSGTYQRSSRRVNLGSLRSAMRAITLREGPEGPIFHGPSPVFRWRGWEKRQRSVSVRAANRNAGGDEAVCRNASRRAGVRGGARLGKPRCVSILLITAGSSIAARMVNGPPHWEQVVMEYPIYGASWEGYVIENIITQIPRWKCSFFRTSNGAEMDLVLEKGRKRIAIEIKASTSPVLSKGFWTSIETIQPDETCIIAPVDGAYPMADKVTVIPLAAFIERIAA